VQIPSVQLEKKKDTEEVVLDQELDDFFNSSQDFDLTSLIDAPPSKPSAKPATNVQTVNTNTPAKLPTQGLKTSFDDMDVNVSASLDMFDDDVSFSLRIPSPPQSQVQSMTVGSEYSAPTHSAMSRGQPTPKTAPIALQNPSTAVASKLTPTPVMNSSIKPRAPTQSSPIKLPSSANLNTLPIAQRRPEPLLDTSLSPKSTSSASISLPSTPQPKARRRLQASGQSHAPGSLLTANKKRAIVDTSDSDLESISDADEDCDMQDVCHEDEADDDIEMSNSSDSSPVNNKKRSQLKNSVALLETEAEV
jgi:hypothetical protein